MDLVPKIPAGRQFIHGYGDGGFRVAGRRWQGSVLVFPDRTLAWPVATMTQATLETLAPVGATPGEIELLLIGCGTTMALPSAALRAALKTRGVAVDAMDTGAACRTYNVLASEGRPVAAALIAVS